jgi:hypothetical protein
MGGESSRANRSSSTTRVAGRDWSTSLALCQCPRCTDVIDDPEQPGKRWLEHNEGPTRPVRRIRVCSKHQQQLCLTRLSAIELEVTPGSREVDICGDAQ